MNRILLKTKAKQIISTKYYAAFLGCFSYYFFSGIFTAQLSAVLTVIMFTGEYVPVVERIGFTKNNGVESIATLIANCTVVLLIACFIVFFVGPLSAGKAFFFLKGREGSFMANSFFDFFREPRYSTALKALIIKNITVFLAFILIIPGFYFKYAYYFVPMIVADDHSIQWRDALKLSRKITRGHKFELFKLDLSFAGWYLLGTVLIIIGIYFVHPYYEATITEAYIFLKKESDQINLA